MQPNLVGANSELMIKLDTEVAHRSREGYARGEEGEPMTVSLCKLPVATKPDGLCFRLIEKEAVSSNPISECHSFLLGQFPQPAGQCESSSANK